MMLLIGIITAYLLGSIPTSYLVGRIKGVDVRQHGSGNIGATNVLRVMGKLPALITLIADIGKGVLAVTAVAIIFYQKNSIINYSVFRALLGLAVIVGHNWTVFLKFKGGKGVATFIGVFMVVFPIGLVIGLIVWLVTVWLTKYVSLGSILMAMIIPIIAAISAARLEVVILSVTCCIIICYRHKGNISRLLSGKE
ncbi:MAG: glycerol-3-phosphate 1-O-acyltransferase PlsY, partial [Candidatus Omnitrophota bacterium]|nr:glycerol-3-phosphate 1-O-acyltransferase PlsY [Candidatus Omnitrophota bacterium]